MLRMVPVVSAKSICTLGRGKVTLGLYVHPVRNKDPVITLSPLVTSALFQGWVTPAG